MRNRMGVAVLLVGLSAAALAVPSVKDVEARYASDKQLCAEEKTSAVRMQCLRDARAEYDSALAAASSATGGKETACAGCGTVTGVRVVQQKGQSSALGLIGGGVAGALLGSQIGHGTGKTLATVAGAAGGAYAGKKVEESAKSHNVWQVHVRFDNGEEHSYNFGSDPGYQSGDLVLKSNGSIVRR